MSQKKKIGILLFRQEQEDAKQTMEADRFIEEAKAMGLEALIYQTQFFSVFFKENKLEIYYNNKKLNPKQFKFFIARYSLTNGHAFHRFSIARYLEAGGIRTFNTAEAALLAKQKRESLFTLSQAGLPIVPTGINYSQFFLDEHLKRNKGNKFVCKINSGSLGYGVTVADSEISFISFMEAIAGKEDPTNILIQPYIESGAEDYRFIVVGNKVNAAMKRKANGIEFRANLSKGGSGTKIKPSKKMTDIAKKAIKVLGLDYGGVDIIKDKKGKLMIVEVNANPMLGIERVCNVNVAREVLKYCIKKS